MQRVGIFVVCLALFAGTISAQNPTMQQAMMSPAVGLMEAQTVAAGAIYEQDGVRITAFPVNHRPIGPAFGYRFDFGGRSVVISGDTVKSKSLTEAARGADLLFHDAMGMACLARFPSMAEAAIHLTRISDRDETTHRLAAVVPSGVSDG